MDLLALLLDLFLELRKGDLGIDSHRLELVIPASDLSISLSFGLGHFSDDLVHNICNLLQFCGLEIEGLVKVFNLRFYSFDSVNVLNLYLICDCAALIHYKLL